MSEVAFQDLMPHNFCFGCGPENPEGLKLKSYWHGEETVATYQPERHQAAGPRQYLNGGIIATVIDCHSICSAIARAYRAEGRRISSEPLIWYATGSLSVRYLHPVRIDKPVELRARFTETGAKKTVVACTLSSEGRLSTTAQVVAVRVPESWFRPAPG